MGLKYNNMKTISLTAVQESENQPKKDVKQITFVAENFELFFNNLTQK